MLEYHELDFIDPLLNEEEIIIKNAIRDFTDSEIIPIINKSYAMAEFPKDLIPKMGALGIFGGNLNLTNYIEDFSKISNTAYGLVMQELERGDSGIRSFASVQSALVMFPILEYASEKQKNTWLKELYNGTKIGCFGLTEEHGGSDPSQMNTRVRKVENGYILNGKKAWITNGEIADIAIVWAVDENSNIIGLIVPADSTGFSYEPMMDKSFKNSMRASITSYLIFDDCFVSGENELAKANGHKAYLGCLNKARYGISWGVIGSAYACFKEVKDYTMSRTLFGEALSHKQLVQFELASMRQDIEIMQSAMLTLGRLADTNNLTHTEISLAKFNNVTKSLKVAMRADELLGANRISCEYVSPRHFANLRAVETYEGTRFIHALIQGADITNYKAF